MGCSFSSSNSASFHSHGSFNDERSQRIDDTNKRLIISLRQKKKQLEEQQEADHPIVLERVLLKFEKMRFVVNKVRKGFNEFAVNGSISTIENLQAAISKVYGPMDIEKIKDLFESADLDFSRSIEFKEFITALTLGMMLEGAPDDDNIELSISHEDINSSMRSPAQRKSDLWEMLNLIASAYLIFDKKCEGFIMKSTVEEVLEVHKKGSNSRSHGGGLTNERWKEMVSNFTYFDY
jgi:Ca2+-binding EF-hand superfamily protein